MTTPSDAPPVAWRTIAYDGTWLICRSRDEALGQRRFEDDPIEPLYPQPALDAERQKREAAERDHAADRAVIKVQAELLSSPAWKRAFFAQARAEAAEASLAGERTIYADKPEDRLYHAADATWWRRDERGCLIRAKAPEVLAEAQARIAELEAALKPFAAIADDYADAEDDYQVWQDFDVLGASLPLRHFRHARAALTNIEKERDDG